MKILWLKEHHPKPLEPVIRARLFTTSLMDTRTPEQMFILQTRESDSSYFSDVNHKDWFIRLYGVTKEEYAILEDTYVHGVGNRLKTILFLVSGLPLPEHFEQKWVIEVNSEQEAREAVFILLKNFLWNENEFLNFQQNMQHEIINFLNNQHTTSSLEKWCSHEVQHAIDFLKEAFIQDLAEILAGNARIQPTKSRRIAK